MKSNKLDVGTRMAELCELEVPIVVLDQLVDWASEQLREGKINGWLSRANRNGGCNVAYVISKRDRI